MLLKIALFASVHGSRAHPAAALDHAEGNGLVLRAATVDLLPAFGRVHVAGFAADEGFVYLDFATEQTAALLHGEADTVHHVPRALLSDADCTVNLPRGRAVLAVREHPHRHEPLVERERRIFENGSDLHAELVAGVTRPALPDAAGGDEGDFLAAAGRAHDAARPAAHCDVVQAVVRVSEVDDGLFEGFGFVLAAHAQQYRLKGPLSQA